MRSRKSYIGRPWIVELLLGYGVGKSRHRPMAAQVTEFVPPENWTKEDEPAAVVHISDLKHYIKTVVTKGAKCDLEQEEENYAFSDIKNKIVILRKFNVLLRLEPELKDCEFYLIVQELKILPTETGISDACSCNLDPAVQKLLSEFWQSHVNNMTAQAGPFSDACLSNLIDAAVEDEDNSLKNTVELCLDPTDSSKASASTSSFLPPSANRTTAWKTMSRNDKNKRGIFTIPEAMLMISSDQEEVLNNLKEWKNGFVCTDNLQSNGGTDAFLHNAVVQEAAFSQNPWNAVSPVCLGGISSSGETCISCNSSSEPYKKHVGKCDGQLCSTFSDAPACSRPAIELQLSDSSIQDPEKSIELYTEGSQQEHSHSEVLRAGSPSETSVTSADRRDRMNVAEPEESPVKLDEDNREKSLNCSRTACNRLFKNISPLSVAANNYSNLNSVSLFKNIAPVLLTAGGNHTNPNGGPCRSSTVVHNHTTAARNNMLEAGEQQLNDSGDEESYEILRAAKRKRQFVDSVNESDGNDVGQGSSWKQPMAVNGDQNSWNLSSAEPFIGTAHFEEITNDVCQMNTITGHEESCRKQEGGRNTMFKDTELRNIPENKMAMASRKYNKLDSVFERPSRQVRSCRRQASSETPIVQPAEDVAASVKHVFSDNVEQDKDKPLGHPDGTQFLYSYPPPTAELITQVNSVRVSRGLLKWAVSYLTGLSLTQD
ncbi:adrenocortical dysplasia protein homolog [Heterodontus francisci]|uniref:adrenocortical dysplasia protein homolog n=1 Tax=Heterodontus francisci TaxID=7792 RepID=UPI00355C3A3D